MQVDTSDPLDWTVDEVVGFLCHNPDQPWSRSATRGPRPDPASLETALRDNFVTGEVLLHDVHKSELREDLGVKTLGHLSSMLRAIRYLQDNSLKFKDTMAYPHYLEDRQNIPSPTPFTPMGVAPRLPSTVRPDPGHTPAHTTPNRGNLQSRSLAIAPSALPTPHNQEAAATNSLANNQVGKRPELTPDTVPEPPQASVVEQDLNLNKRREASDPRFHVPARDHIVIDSSGKKRLRLDLQDSARVQNHAQTSKVLNAPEGKVWYMGPERITHSDIFYSSGLDDNDRSFMMTGSDLPVAQRRFVNKSLGYFYRQQPIKLAPSRTGTGSTQWALMPYSAKVVNADNPKLFTLYAANKEGVTVSKERMSDWPQFNTSQSGPQNGFTEAADRHDPYASLLQKYPPQKDDQDICPLYGDSGSEGEYDDETWQEMQEEQRETVPHRLTHTEVQDIIMGCISDYKEKWRQNGQQKEQAKAQKLWLTARRNRCTNQKVKALNQETINLEKRLTKLQQHICDGTFSSRAELQTQCQSMEQTVTDIEKCKWRASTLEQEACPPRSSTPPRRLHASKPRQNLEDEESLHSESDYLTDASPDDFIHDPSDVEEAAQRDDIPMTTPSTSDSDDDIISPSGIRRNSRKSRRLPFRESSSPVPSPNHDATASYIDLTAASPPPDEFKIETPPLNPVQPVVAQPLEDPFISNRTSPSFSPEPQLSPSLSVEIPVKTMAPSRHPKHRASPSLPSFDDHKGIKQVSWDLLAERKDRGRLLIKSLISMSVEERKSLASNIPKYDVQLLRGLITTALQRVLEKKKFIPDMKNSKSAIIMRTAALYISWVNCTHINQEGIRRILIENAQEDLQGGFSAFFKALCQHLERLVQSPPKKKDGLGHLEERNANQTATPHKKRKREVKESQSVKINQQSAQMRVKQNEELRRKVEQKMQSMGVSNTDATHQAVNVKDPIIYLDPHIGSRVKSHQLKGIRFMWRELLEDENEQGCLLAHTMGLGKTMQVISLLATISVAAASDDPSIRQQVPPDLAESKTLILCPAALIENWYDEFIMWRPPNSPIGPLRKVTSSSALQERFQTLAGWDAEGGILIIGYEIFQKWVSNGNSNGKPRLSDEYHRNVRRILLDGPNIVVADEAHKMKNANSCIAQATVQFRTKRRIALTGSPLANNLVDYYTMVDWIAAGYLGNFVEFKANFVEPIEEGLYADSTRQERRKSLIKLKALNNNLEPKLHRLDVTILEENLPPKTEFVLTVPLTQLQKAAYDLYVQSTVQGKGDECINNTRLWSWLGVLSLCCYHPTCFREKLLSRASSAPKPDKKSPEADEQRDDSVFEAPLPDSDELISIQERLFKTVSDMKALELSYRVVILDRIIAETINAGDKLLVFSHSIPTLDYMEYMMEKAGRKYCRLDGHTPAHSRQAATKHFNHGSGEHVYLISTRAGGLGLNIPGANRVVIFDFGFSPMWEQQAVGRVYRLGQRKPVFVYRFVAGGTFEELVYNRATFKTQLSSRVVDKRNPIRAATKPLKNYLFPAKAVPDTDTTEFLGTDPHVLDKILIDKDTYPIRKIRLTKTFEKDENETLSLEEEQHVQQETSDLTLRRTDPVAYQKLMEERQRAALAASRINAPGPSQLPAASPYTSYIQPSVQPYTQFAPFPYAYPPNLALYQSQQQVLPQPSPPVPTPIVPSNAHNDGPPPLAPDTIS